MAVAQSESHVFVSAGSNIEPERHLHAALCEMEESFGSLARSSVYRTTAIGFAGDDFLNLVVSFKTTLPVGAVVSTLDDIEKSAGRRRDARRFAPRTLDLDLLMYADRVVDSPDLKLPRADIMKYAFVLGPLAELAPHLEHPVEGATMRDLWGRFDQADQPIRRLSPAPF